VPALTLEQSSCWGVQENQGLDTFGRVQLNSSKGTREQSGANYPHNQGTSAQAPGDAPVLTHPTTDEDQIYLLYGIVVECLLCEKWDIGRPLAQRAACLLET
jgi:hypothetical protein